jgi:hypothetical protein
MSKNFKKKKGSVETLNASDVIKKQKFQKNKKYMLALVVNTVVIASVYMYTVKQPYFMAVLWTYLALTVGFSSAYIIYNRAFSRKGVTPEMLPDTMTELEKSEWIADGERRMEKSKWMLTVIFPLIMTFCLDLFILYVLEPLFLGIGG